MKALVLTTSQLEDIYFEKSDRFEMVEEGEWEQQHKCQACCFLFKDSKTDLMYEGSIGRSGSPFTDWTYDSEIMGDEKETFYPIEEVEVVVKEWKYVSEDRITETEKVEKI